MGEFVCGKWGVGLLGGSFGGTRSILRKLKEGAERGVAVKPGRSWRLAGFCAEIPAVRVREGTGGTLIA